jgi:hypothetical protein
MESGRRYSPETLRKERAWKRRVGGGGEAWLKCKGLGSGAGAESRVDKDGRSV